jgi:hypothetical protein
VQKHQQQSARRPASFSWLGHKLALVIRLHSRFCYPSKQDDGTFGTSKAAAAAAAGAARTSLCRGLNLDRLMRPRRALHLVGTTTATAGHPARYHIFPAPSSHSMANHFAEVMLTDSQPPDRISKYNQSECLPIPGMRLFAFGSSPWRCYDCWRRRQQQAKRRRPHCSACRRTVHSPASTPACCPCTHRGRRRHLRVGSALFLTRKNKPTHSSIHSK